MVRYINAPGYEKHKAGQPAQLGKRMRDHIKSISKQTKIQEDFQLRRLKNLTKDIRTIDDLLQLDKVVAVVISSNGRNNHIEQAYFPEIAPKRMYVEGEHIALVEGTPAQLIQKYFKTNKKRTELYESLMGKSPEKAYK